MAIRWTFAPLCAALVLSCGGRATRTETYVPIEGGLRLHAVIVGDGPDTVVVLHGGPALQSSYLVDALQPLAPGRTLIFYDQRGRGESDPVTNTLQLGADFDVGDLEAVRSHFHLDSLTLIGHHWGAAIAGLYAARYPGHVRRMLMVSPYLVHPSFVLELAYLGRDSGYAARLNSARTALTTETAQSYCREFWPTYFDPIPQDPNLRTADLAKSICDAPSDRLMQVDRVNREIVRTLGYWSWRVGLNGVHIPVLVMEGTGQPILEASATRWAQHLPDSRLDLLPAPHTFPWLGDPARFRADADAFLRGTWPGTATKPPPFVLPDSA